MRGGGSFMRCGNLLLRHCGSFMRSGGSLYERSWLIREMW
jgi:hypothetical protein